MYRKKQKKTGSYFYGPVFLHLISQIARNKAHADDFHRLFFSTLNKSDFEYANQIMFNSRQNWKFL